MVTDTGTTWLSARSWRKSEWQELRSKEALDAEAFANIWCIDLDGFPPLLAGQVYCQFLLYPWLISTDSHRESSVGDAKDVIKSCLEADSHNLPPIILQLQQGQEWAAPEGVGGP